MCVVIFMKSLILSENGCETYNIVYESEDNLNTAYHRNCESCLVIYCVAVFASVVGSLESLVSLGSDKLYDFLLLLSVASPQQRIIIRDNQDVIVRTKLVMVMVTVLAIVILVDFVMVAMMANVTLMVIMMVLVMVNAMEIAMVMLKMPWQIGQLSLIRERKTISDVAKLCL